MNNQKNSSVPASIQLLFNNEKLEIMKVLCLLNAFVIQSNKQRKLEEISFYYCLVNFNLTYLFDFDLDNRQDFHPSPNLYFRFQTKINEILLIMSHLEYIEIRGDLSTKFHEIKVKLLPEGKRFYEKHNSEYFTDLLYKYTLVFEKIKYNSENVKIIKEGK